MFAVVVVLLNALSFASLANVADRKGLHTMAASLAAGVWRRRRADLGLALAASRRPGPSARPDAKLDRRSFLVRDANGQALAYVYFEEGPGRCTAAKLLTRRGFSPAMHLQGRPQPVRHAWYATGSYNEREQSYHRNQRNPACDQGAHQPMHGKTPRASPPPSGRMVQFRPSLEVK